MSTELRHWLKHSGGLSSYSITWALCPELRDFVDGCSGSFGIGSAPCDPSDFRRCREVLKLIPDGAVRLGEVAAAFPSTEWPALVAAWPELDALYEAESKNESGMAPKLYKRMQAIRDGFHSKRRGVGS